MFYHVRGILVSKEPSLAVVECGGVGYALTVSQTTFDGLSDALSKEVRLYTHLAVREDGVELFGFLRKEELDAFRLLITVSGVGPKAAMAILSLFTPERLAVAVAAEDARAIAKANGVGPKTAARIVLELKDKMAAEAPVLSGDGASLTATDAKATGDSGILREAESALLVLGYHRSEIAEALRAIDTKSMSLEDIITAALRRFMK